MSSKPSFSLGRAVSAAFASLPAAWGGAWLALALLWLLGSFGHLVLLHAYATGGGVSLHLALALGLCALLLVAKLAVQGALYRVAVFGNDARKEGLGFGGLQFALPEVRLFITTIVVVLFILLIAAAMFIVFAVAFNSSGLMAGHDSTPEALGAMLVRHQGVDWVFIGYMIAAWVFLIFVELKFVLAYVATIAERRTVTLNALGLSSGNVGKLFLGLLLFCLPLIAIVIAIICHLSGKGIMVDNVNDTARLIVHAAIQAFVVFVIAPLMVGFLASAYRQIVQSRAK